MPILPSPIDIANGLRIPERDYIWAYSHNVSIVIVQILEWDLSVSPVVEQSPSVCERGQERAIEASKAIYITGR